MCWAYEQTVGDPAAKFVLIVLADVSEGTEFSWPLLHLPALARRTELPEDRLRRALEILLTRGYVRRGAVWAGSERVEGLVLNVFNAEQELSA